MTETHDRTCLVRPYAITTGLAPSPREFRPSDRVSTLVEQTAPADLRPEQQDIVRWCQLPTTLSDLSGLLGIPPGVTDVLVDDLLMRGLVTVDRTGRPRYRGRHRPTVAEAHIQHHR